MTDNGVLVHCEATGDRLAAIATEVLGAGRHLALELGKSLSAVLIGCNMGSAAREAIAYGADRVYVIDNPLFKDYLTDLYMQAMEKVINEENPGIVLLGQTRIGQDLTPRLAFRMNTAAVMDCIALSIDHDSKRMLMTKPVYGGNAQSLQVCETDPQLATIRSKALSPAEKDTDHEGEIVNIDADSYQECIRTRVLNRQIEAAHGVKLEDAGVVVTGGRGIGGAEGFKELEELAGIFKGAIGASRPACDNKWVSDNIQVGLTGRIVSPDLYIAVGVSGSSQHLSGCSGSKVIVAINKDPDANIFNVARYGIIADWKKVLPAFTARVRELI
ncbi:MAG: electron transfer flavoprotein subunit alpha/FixB family protein [Deltaproteobacteria bacterium]|nr:electron transfer flavoprotein subunit alpha/FixB family protein [Deltaproteobacteria bacterium]